jgi:hydroxymethylpyrimidine/phosphomethylpyrimidine kinase
MTAITAITAQNTVGVTAIHPVPPEVIVAQVAAVVEDIGVDAIKIGMLGNAETIAAVARALDSLPEPVPVVLDPVMVSESGAVLLEEAARRALVQELFPRATVVTPNLPEARAIAQAAPGPRGAAADEAALDGVALARTLRALGPQIVILTGGHRETATDLFFDGAQTVELDGPRHPDGAAHGSGCTHSSVLAACLARGDTPLAAARTARAMAARAVAHGLREIGSGAGPVDVLGLAARHGRGRGVVSG